MSLSAGALVGAWALEAFGVTLDDGRPPRHPFGADARGLLVYTADGFMSAVLSRADRPPVGEGGLERAHLASPEAKAAAFDSYLSYAGTWRVEGARVIHDVTLCQVPEQVGHAHVREARLVEGTLTLAYDVDTRGGGTARYTLRWRRPAASPSSS